VALEMVQNNTIFTLGQNNLYPGALRCNGMLVDNIKANVPAVCPAPRLV
jgi:hypothetical protein